jgi:cell division protease FtsH
LKAPTGVIVIAATNRPDVLDPGAVAAWAASIARSWFPLPDIRGREQILMVHMRKVPVAPDVEGRHVIARGTPGFFRRADLANLVNEAALFAARGNKRLVEMDDFEKRQGQDHDGRGAPFDGHARGGAQEHRLP